MSVPQTVGSTFYYVFNDVGLEKSLQPYVERRFAPQDREAAKALVKDFLASPEAAKLRGESK